MGRMFAAFYDRAMAGSERAGLGAWRRALLSHVHGVTVELGSGTGVNLAHYGDRPERLVLTETAPPPDQKGRGGGSVCSGRPSGLTKGSRARLVASFKLPGHL